MKAAKRVPDEYAFDTGLKAVPRLHRVAAIYGPNGSGKSQFLDALSFAVNFVLESVMRSNLKKQIATVPFRFDAEAMREPSTFYFQFAVGGDIFWYSFAVDSEKVWFESLSMRPAGANRRRWFTRSLNPATGKTSWRFGPSLKGSVGVWKKTTRPDALFVSTAILLNSESLSPVNNWFSDFRIVGAWPEQALSRMAAEWLKENPTMNKKIVGFLRDADISLESLRVRKLTLTELAADISFDELLRYSEGPEDAKILVPEFGFAAKGMDGLVYLPLRDQSDGTKRMFSLTPWWLLMTANGKLLAVDELDQSLHPHLVEFLLRYINRTKSNKAQLIATLHDATQFSGDALHRDQIWLTEKNDEQVSALFPLAGFGPRKKESLIRGYLGGRYGALPNIRELAYYE